MVMADGTTSLRDIGWRIRLLREALGFANAARFAAHIGWTPQLLNNYERGAKRPELGKAVQLCNATGVTLDWIYRGERAGLPFERVSAIDAHLAHLADLGKTQA